MHRTSLLACLLVLGIALIAGPASAGEVRGELAQWHEIEVWFRGPAHAESDSGPNPFLDYRLQCLFRGPSGQTYDVPGFFDTDGAGGQSGDVWVCRFSPDEEGAWSYQASFRQGSQVAVSLDAGAGSATAFDGDAGVFAVGPSAASGRDFRSPERGLLTNVGDHYLTFAGSGGAWVKGAIDVPENFFGYEGFDNTPAARHAFPGHAGDWRPGDPDWGNGDGRAIIGAINYLAETGANGFYFLPMNVGGDGKDTYPTLAPQDKTHYDTSKLRQWNVVLGHAQSLGVFVHFQLAETESGNENYHDGGQLGPQRKLYYRELIARFGHHPGIQFDLGEENDYGTNRRRVFAAHLKALDPYDHPVTTHIHTNQMESFYGPLLGNDDFDMTAFQINSGGFDQGDAVTEWRTRSAAAGAPWVVSIDEPQKIENDPNDAQNGYPHGRTNFLWPTYLSGGGGFEWYIQEDGGGHSFDQRIEDLREADVALRWTGHALDFLAELPLLDMEPLAALGRSSAGGRTYVLAIPGDVYALYHPKGGSLELDLRGHDGLYTVEWFHPRNGTWQPGPTLTGGVWVELGQAPFGGDAAALVTREGDAPNEAPVASFSVTPSTGEAPLAVRLDASGSTDDSTVVDYDWTLGDGATPAGPIVDHVFTAPGVYVVRLEVTDDEGARAMASREVVATDPTPDPDPTPGPDPTPVPDPAPSYALLVSQQPNRAGAVPLPGQTLTGNVYIFVHPGDGIGRATFFLDDPGQSGPPQQVENYAPHDLGGTAGGQAKPFAIDDLGAGMHRLDVRLDLENGTIAYLATEFAVAGMPPAPDPDPTPDPNPKPDPDPTPDSLRLLVSSEATRGGALPLDGGTVSGEVFPFLGAMTGVAQVRFWLDSPQRTGKPRQTENFAPYDFGGGSVETAQPFATETLADGPHRIDAEVDLADGRTVIVHAGFVVANEELPRFGIVMSRYADRRGPIVLEGRPVSGSIYPFLTVPEGRAIQRVRFWLDDAQGGSKPRQTERFAPYDFAGGSVETARPFDTGKVAPGRHRIDAEVVYADGSTERAAVSFEVVN